MATDRPVGGLEIGKILKEARQRAGLDISAVEQRTKIRTRYLRALENEQWEVLPGHAYAKGFLRTYAQVLGLDAEALVDEYRRYVERPVTGHYPLGEPVLQARRRGDDLGEPRWQPGRGAVIAALAAVLVAILLVLGLWGGGSEDRDRGAERERRGEAQKEDRKKDEQQQQQPEGLPLRLVAASTVQVCLLNGEGEALIDGATLEAGQEEQFGSQRYELRFPAGFDQGQVELFVDGEQMQLTDFLGPVTYSIDPPGRVSEPEELTEQGCP